MKSGITLVAWWVAIAALAAMGCAPSSDSGSSSKKSSNDSGDESGECTGDLEVSGTAILSSSMTAGSAINNPGGFPQGGKVFLVGLPSVQATVDPGNGTFSLTVPEDDAGSGDTGLTCGESATLIAWWPAESFVEVAGVKMEFTLEKSSEVGTLTLDWTRANHVTISNLSGTWQSTTFPGISDDAAHGFAMARDPSSGTFDSNYLPPGTYPIAVTTSTGAYTGSLDFAAPNPGESANQWDSPSITVQ